MNQRWIRGSEKLQIHSFIICITSMQLNWIKLILIEKNNQGENKIVGIY